MHDSTCCTNNREKKKLDDDCEEGDEVCKRPQ